jgi:membrane protein
VRTWSSGAWGWLKELWKRLDDTRALGVAAETAFWIFLSLMPLLAVMGLVAARFSAEDWSSVAPLLSSLPRAGRQLLRKELAELAAWNGGTVSFLSTVIFVWLASSGMHSIFDALELQVGASRSWWRKRLISIVVCFLLPLVVALLAMVAPGFDEALAYLRVVQPGEASPLKQAVRGLGSVVLLFGYVYGLYWLGIPPRKRRRMPLAPGAMVAVMLQIALSFGYSFYIARVGDGSAYVAGLAVIGITLMGLYLFSAALLVGAVLNRMLGDATEARLKAELPALSDSPGTPRAGAHG